jgi:hypothetical protein
MPKAASVAANSRGERPVLVHFTNLGRYPLTLNALRIYFKRTQWRKVVIKSVILKQTAKDLTDIPFRATASKRATVEIHLSPTSHPHMGRIKKAANVTDTKLLCRGSWPDT